MRPARGSPPVGRHAGQSCYARLIAVEGSRVLLEDPKGERMWFLAINFSEKDQAYLKPYLENQPGRSADSTPKKSRGGQVNRSKR